MKAIILAGGSGTRLWPASTHAFPKQFLDIDGKGVLLSQTLNRCQRLGMGNECYVITRGSYADHVLTLMNAFNPQCANNVIAEPLARNTAPAILLAAKYLESIAGADKTDVMLFLPSDHLIVENATFLQSFNLGEKLAKAGNIVIFGILPDKPETGYGYIKAPSTNLAAMDPLMGQAFPVSAFKEKPSREVAESYLLEGGYYWNAGIFALTIETLYAELRNHFSEIEPFLTMNYETLLSHFAELPSISFDFAVMEKTDRAVVIPMDVQWSDVGSWDSIYEMLPKDEAGNVIQGNVIADGTTSSLLVNKTDRPMAVSGFSQVIAIQTQDGFLLTNLGESQKIGQIQSQLQPQLVGLSPA